MQPLSLPLAVLGLAVFYGAMYYAWSNHAIRWRKLASKFGVASLPSKAPRKHLQAVVLFGLSRFLYTSYAGITTVVVTDEGVGFKLLPGFSWLHRPLFIPFAKLQSRQADWYLNAASFELIAADVPDIRILIDGGLLDWIAANTPRWQVDTRRMW